MDKGSFRVMYSKISNGLAILMTKTFYRIGSIGNRSFIKNPLKLVNPQGISLGRKTVVHDHAWIICGKKSKGSLVIGDGTIIGHFAHLVAMNSVCIGDNVLFADRVFISDCTHNYSDASIPIINQEVKVIKPIRIGEDSWIGENVCVCGANVGKHCVIGANSVVTKDIPDYCVAVGSPAKVVKKYDFESNEWKRVGDT